MFFYALACLAAAAAVFALVATPASSAPAAGGSQPSRLKYEDELRGRLAATDRVYAKFGALADEIAALVKSYAKPSYLAKLNHALEVCGLSPPWRAEQLAAVKFLEGCLGGGCVGLIVLLFSRSMTGALIIGGIFTACYVAVTLTAVADRASLRARRIRARMSFATDLMALVMQAGGTSVESFDAVVKENDGHPLGEEFARVAGETRMGRVRADSLAAFRLRYPDPDISDFVFAVIKGEELGTPLAEILNSQAAQMRLKHSQWCEKQAAEAGVKMTFPSLLIMLACICVIVGPLLLPVIYSTQP
jgi:tight adherence protein C